MIRVLSCVAEQHDIRLVSLAALICVFGCYTTFRVLGRGWFPAAGRKSLFWVSLAAFVAGGTIWAAHFVAMLAYRSDLLAGYAVDLTILSVIISIAITWLSFFLAVCRKATATGGVIFGCAVAAMHYVGMAALSVPAHFHWQLSYIVGSVLCGIIFGFAAIYVALNKTGVYWRVIGTALMTLAITGMHFTGMTALTLEPDPLVPVVTQVLLAPEWLAALIALLMSMIIFAGLAVSILDEHLVSKTAREAARLRSYVIELEETKRQLGSTTESLTEALAAATASSQAKGQFLASMSHELRTPLNAIIGFSELLRGEIYGPLGDERYKTYIDDVHDSGRLLLDLVNDVLDFAKLDAKHLTLREDSIDLSRTLFLVMRMVSGFANDSGVELSEQIDPDLPFIRADERRIRQIMLNLLSNATKFVEKEGKVIVVASRVAEGIKITVTDNGIGIAEEHLAQIFEPFGQVHNSLNRSYNGAGLGLPLAKGLTELLGGTLTLTSILGQGTIATVIFPAACIITEAVGMSDTRDAATVDP